MNKQIRPGRPSLLLANRDPDDTDEEAYEKALAELESGPVPEFSGLRLYQRDPRKYALACRMIAENLSTRMISRALAISPHTVQAIRLREDTPAQLEKSRLSDLARSTSRMCLERLAELIPEMSARDLAIGAGICIDKALLLQGEATVITESNVHHISHAEYNALLDAIDVARVVGVENKR